MSANLTTKCSIQFDSDLANFHLLVLVLSLFSSLRDVYANFKFIAFVFSTCRFERNILQIRKIILLLSLKKFTLSK